MTHARRSPGDSRRPRRALARNEDGSVLPYFAVLAAVLVGSVGLSVDVGRMVGTNTEAKSAADAAALSAAAILASAIRTPGQDAASIRTAVANAASSIAVNRQTFASAAGGASASTGGAVQVTRVRMLTGLPEQNGGSSSTPISAAYETTDPWQARFVEVTTESLTTTSMFAPVVGAASTSQTNAVAVAGVTQVVCRIPPVWICNPADNGTTTNPIFDGSTWRGREALLKASGANASWTPGNFGLLDAPAGQGASAVADLLASVAPNACFKSEGVDLRPGGASSVRTAFNTRFDMYEAPFFNGTAKTDPSYRPAVNVTKGYIQASGGGGKGKGSGGGGGGGNACNLTASSPPTAMGLPRDKDLTTSNRFGNGQWDCPSYWAVNHPGQTAPANCTNPSGMTRYEMYRYEIDNNMIPNNGAGRENGNPACYSNAGTPPSDSPDRRVIYFAIVNCSQHALNGNRDDVPVAAFGKAFLPEPVVNKGGDDEVVVEFIDVVKVGADDGVLHEIVQLYR
ncbi:pilus assembly protein TadG-related protein [Azospirillum rugosum]|uniref:Flp pilus assembly protein TadG n=1 Tax=Azospirillum rugosum TaxID=416170 RepID=A0ABS4SPA2_9PROT|nr:pilus assembly protein TadG-related protein [Azospirillum rugosum]MBP2293767.1 Flp pilus assembly protein TadG [Azospirillum rugosum]MDQ0527312.1 Flp pilus assembly protein TadG [Azospirillum rugosum]